MTDLPASLFVGTAGWTLPRAEQHRFPEPGAHLARYAAHLPAAEINSSFYRPHRRATYERWAATVPPSVRFSVKIPKTVTHEQRLVDTEQLLDEFLADIAGLGDRLGCLLVQLPPKLELDVAIARRFFTALRARHSRGIAVEPRHPSWFTPDAGHLLDELHVARVAADPAIVPVAAEPGGSRSMIYYRLHGSPRMYYSAYESAALETLASQLKISRAAGVTVWCIFDNTAHGAALGNALALLERLRSP